MCCFLIDTIRREHKAGLFSPTESVAAEFTGSTNNMSYNQPIGMMSERGQVDTLKSLAAKSLLYYNSKINTKPLNIKLPKLSPKTTHYEYFGYHVTVTNEIDQAIMFVHNNVIGPVVVDNEADRGLINAMIIQPLTGRTVLLYHGPEVYYRQFDVYAKLDSQATMCIAWGDNFEIDYPRLRNVQKEFNLISGSTSTEVFSLAEAAKSYGLPVAKQAKVDYSLYTQNEVS